MDFLPKKTSRNYKCGITSNEDFCERRGFSVELPGLVTCVKLAVKAGSKCGAVSLFVVFMFAGVGGS